MLKKNTELIKRELMSGRMMDFVSQISLRHRIQATDGYRDAAQWCAGALSALGVQTEVLSYRAAPKESAFQSRHFYEWECTGARLELVSPHEEILGDWQDCAQFVMSRSGAADFRERGLEVVYLDEDCKEEDCKDIDLEGKLIFSSAAAASLAWAFNKRGAVGMITDRIVCFGGFRIPEELLDSRGYCSFSYSDTVFEKQPCGFVLTVRQGLALRRLCRRMERERAADPAKPRYPVVRGYVSARLFDGHMENVSAVIPGETDEEIMLSAHLCHPKPSSNDNASGSAAVMEIMATLARLISEGRLPKPRRTIRALLVPEMTGSYAYLASLTPEQRGRIAAGFNLDMVGAKQAPDAGGPVCIHRTPEYMASFANDLAELITEYVTAAPADILSDGGVKYEYNFRVKGFSGGSDHQVFNDPTIGVPYLDMTQWPDRHYHTSTDSPDKIDSGVLRCSAAIAGAWAYAMATLERGDLPEIFAKAAESFTRACGEQLGRWQSGGEGDGGQLVQRMEFACDNACRALRGLMRFFPGDEELELLIEAECNRYEDMCHGFARRVMGLCGVERTPLPAQDAELERVPVRLFVSEMSREALKEYLEKPQHAAVKEKMNPMRGLENHIAAWMDGERSVGEIARCVMLDSGECDAEYALAYIRLLVDAGMAKWRN